MKDEYVLRHAAIVFDVDSVVSKFKKLRYIDEIIWCYLRFDKSSTLHRESIQKRTTTGGDNGKVFLPPLYLTFNPRPVLVGQDEPEDVISSRDGLFSNVARKPALE